MWDRNKTFRNIQLINTSMKKNMRKIVEEGYNKNDYKSFFRMSPKLNEFELLFVNSLVARLPKEAKILDLGSGLGIPYDSYLAAHGFNITGVDISQKHVKMAKKNVPKAKFIKGDFTRIKLKGTFDAVISLYAIFHIPRREHRKLFLNIAKLLNEKGILLVTLGTKAESYGEEDNWAGAKMAWSSYSPETYKTLLNGSGFKILKAKFEGHKGDEEYHFWILAQKT